MVARGILGPHLALGVLRNAMLVRWSARHRPGPTSAGSSRLQSSSRVPRDDNLVVVVVVVVLASS